MNTILRRRRALMGAQGGGFVHGTWEDLFRSIDAGTYASEYSTGEKIPLDLGTQGTINMEIVKFNGDVDENGNTVPVSMIGVELLTTSKQYNPAQDGETEGTGNIGGWEKSELRAYMSGTVYGLIPSLVKNRIVTVKKYTQGHTDSTTNNKNMVSYDKVWCPSYREVSNNTTLESRGVTYPTTDSNTWRTKHKWNSTTKIQWWTRSGYHSNATQAVAITAAGVNSAGIYKAVTSYFGVPIGFCVG